MKNFSKRIISAILTVSMLFTLSASAFAEGTEEITFSDDMTQEELMQGEVTIEDTIYGITLYDRVDYPIKGRANCPNYAESQEDWLVLYTGYIQFVPAYKTSAADGYGLLSGRNVRRAWMDYVYGPDRVSVTQGGKQFTEEASSKQDANVYSATASAVDDLFTWGEAGRTYFSRGWLYFS